jgi:hypothetical protein
MKIVAASARPTQKSVPSGNADKGPKTNMTGDMTMKRSIGNLYLSALGMKTPPKIKRIPALIKIALAVKG